MQAVEKYPEADALNICPGKSHTIKDVVGAILKALDFHPEVVFNSGKPSAIPYKVSHPGKAKRVLGWEAQVDLEDGIRKTIEWYLEHKG